MTADENSSTGVEALKSAVGIPSESENVRMNKFSGVGELDSKRVTIRGFMCTDPEKPDWWSPRIDSSANELYSKRRVESEG